LIDLENSRILLFDYCFNSVVILFLGILIPFSVVEFLLVANTMKSFLERLAARDELGRVGGRSSFRDLGMGETAALSHSTLLMALSKIEGPVEGNAEGASIPCKQVAEKTSP
jgi:hypothetical protein